MKKRNRWTQCLWIGLWGGLASGAFAQVSAPTNSVSVELFQINPAEGTPLALQQATNAPEYISWMREQAELAAQSGIEVEATEIPAGEEPQGYSSFVEESDGTIVQPVNEYTRIVQRPVPNASGLSDPPGVASSPAASTVVAGRALPRGYIELGSGLQYQDELGTWRKSKAESEILPDGSVAFRQLPTMRFFAPSSGQRVVVKSMRREGPEAHSAMGGLSYYDPQSGKTALIAWITNTQVSVYDGGVYYADTFVGVQADLVYKVHPWGMEQDVVIYGGLPDPALFGMDPDNTRLCALTELVDLDLAKTGIDRVGDVLPAEPANAPLTISVQTADEWQTIYDLVPSYAYAEEGEMFLGGAEMQKNGHRVSMRVFSAYGRVFLSEEVEFPNVKAAAPAIISSRRSVVLPFEVAQERYPVAIPPAHLELAETDLPKVNPSEQASYRPRGDKRYVLDYVNLSGSIGTGLTFESGYTYYVSSAMYIGGGTLTIESGAVVKFNTNAYFYVVDPTVLDSRATLTSPAIFTSAMDTNVGEVVFSGQDPVTNKYPYGFWFNSQESRLSGLSFRFAKVAIYCNTSGEDQYRDMEFHNCTTAISVWGGDLCRVSNVLVENCTNGVFGWSSSLTVENSTFSKAVGTAIQQNLYSLQVQNCLFHNVNKALVTNNISTNTVTLIGNAAYNVTTGWLGSSVVSLASNTFVVGPFGSNYLNQASPAVNAGTTNAGAVGLYHYTTSTNGVKETNSTVDIGFHYATTNDLDGDGLADYVEDSSGNGSFDGDDLSDLNDTDTDDDGLNDAEEHALGTSPRTSDTDGDGYSDYAEVAYGTDPLNAASFPATISGQTSYAGSQTGTIYISLTPYAVIANQAALSLSFDAAHPTYDNSAWQNPLTVNGATWTTNGKHGGAYSFDGNDTITLGKLYQAVGINNLSWGAWIAAEPGIWLGGVLGKTYFGDDSIYLILNSDGTGLDSRVKPDSGTERDASTGDVITNGIWQHVFVTYDGTKSRLYLNGSLVATSAVFSAQPVRSNDVTATLGDLSSGAGWYFKGRMDEVRLYRATLTDAEIAGIYRSSFTDEYTQTTSQSTTGAYSIANVPTLSNYWVIAWRDSNGNGFRDYYEPIGAYDANGFLLTGSVATVDIELNDPDSDGDGVSDWQEIQDGTDPADPLSFSVKVSGVVSYSGGQTGLIVVSAEIESGLLLHYDFDTPNTSRVPNVISTLYTGSVNGALYVTNGYTGGAYWYDGTNDYILVGPMGVLPEGTISYWVNPDVVENWRNPFTTDYAGWDDCIRFEAYSSGEFIGAGYGLTGQCWYTASMPTASWQHIVLTWNQSNAWGYYNGTYKFQSSHQGQGGTIGLNPSFDNVAIGNGYSTAANRYWKGRIDEVKIYDRTLSGNEVASLYATGSGTGILTFTTTIAGPGPYVISNIPGRFAYRLNAWRDSNMNGAQDSAEACGTYSNNPIVASTSVSNVNMALVDPDTDLDGMPDWWEIQHGLNPNSDEDADGDPDRDQLLTLEEYLYATDPNNYDSDGDLLADGAEVNRYETDPTQWDSTGIGVSDAYQKLLADPYPGLDMRLYYVGPSNSCFALKLTGTTNDSIYEFYYSDNLLLGFKLAETAVSGLYPEIVWLDCGGPGRINLPPFRSYMAGLADDPDGDGLGSGYEYFFLGTSPDMWDTDGDGISDGDEDFDGDGRSNAAEYNSPAYGYYNPCIRGSSDQWVMDSDGDGISDGTIGNGGSITNGPDAFPLDPFGYRDIDCDGLPDGVNTNFPSNSSPALRVDANDDPVGSFRVWAPNATSATVRGEFNAWGESALTNEGNGYWRGIVANAQSGQQYKFHFSSAPWKQDPLSRQVKSVDHNSVIRGTNAFNWTDSSFVPPSRNKLVIYQLHIGGFNRVGGTGGTFKTATNLLDYVAGLGVNAVKIMPIWEFDGPHSWGYNPVNPYTIERDYGDPDDFKTFVNACHAKGLAVILDVVYNHWDDRADNGGLVKYDGWTNTINPGGIYFYEDPSSNKWLYATPWGPRPNYRRAEVRQYIRNNAMLWLHEYHCDGLRWDATHMIRNYDQLFRDPPTNDIPEGWTLIQQINDDLRMVKTNYIAIAEDILVNTNNRKVTVSTALNGLGFDARWSPFVHEIRNNIANADPWIARLKEELEFAYASDPFDRVIYVESHDEVGALNEKKRFAQQIAELGNPPVTNVTSTTVQKRAVLGAALTFTAPGIPMFFMGQEFLQAGAWSETNALTWNNTNTLSSVVQMHKDLIALRKNTAGNTAGLLGTGLHVNNPVDDGNNILAFHRYGQRGPGDDVMVIANLSGTAWTQSNYEIGFPTSGVWKIRFNSDSKTYNAGFGGIPATNQIAVSSGSQPMHGHPFRAAVNMGAYGIIVLSQEAP